MNSRLTLPNKKVSVSRLGMRFNGNLSVEEWQDLAVSIGELATSIAFIVGDWLVYGQNLFGKDGYPDKKVDHPSYQLSIKATGLDLSTLQNYAFQPAHLLNGGGVVGERAGNQVDQAGLADIQGTWLAATVSSNGLSPITQSSASTRVI
jgi:hypothetical protein